MTSTSTTPLQNLLRIKHHKLSPADLRGIPLNLIQKITTADRSVISETLQRQVNLHDRLFLHRSSHQHTCSNILKRTALIMLHRSYRAYSISILLCKYIRSIRRLLFAFARPIPLLSDVVSIEYLDSPTPNFGNAHSIDFVSSLRDLLGDQTYILSRPSYSKPAGIPSYDYLYSTKTLDCLIKAVFYCTLLHSLGVLFLIIRRPAFMFLIDSMLIIHITSRYLPSTLPSKLIFTNSGPPTPPLWCFFFGSYGSETHYFFYSTNNNDSYLSGGKLCSEPRIFWQSFWGWPIVHAWDHAHAEWVHRLSPDSFTIVDGPIHFSDNTEIELFLPESFIALFTLPLRSSSSIYHPYTPQHHTPDEIRRLLSELLSIYHQTGIPYVIKLKRHSSLIVDAVPEGDQIILDYISQHPNCFIPVDPSISAYRLFSKAILSIGYPFTSVVHAANLHGYSSFYVRSHNSPLPSTSSTAHILEYLNRITSSSTPPKCIFSPPDIQACPSCDNQ